MAQLRLDYQKFIERDTEIIVVGPDSRSAFKDFWTKNDIPFIGLPDPEHRVADIYGQQVKWLKAGRMPAMMLIDKVGRIRFRHYANSMADIPANQTILGFIDQMNEEEIGGTRGSSE
jgi:peroxiredoxin Q/BCP